MIAVRPSVPRDRTSLETLDRAALQRAPAVFLYEYESGPEVFLALQGDKPRLWVAEDGGRLVGSIAESQRRGVIDGREGDLYYLGGLRVAPGASSMAGFALMTRARRSFEERRCGLGTALILSGNRPALDFVLSFTRRRNRVIRAGEVVTSTIPPFPLYRLSGKYRLRAGRPEDIPQIARLLAATHARHYGPPPFSGEWLNGVLAGTPGLSAGDFRVAERNSRIAAAAAFWDQRAVRRLKIAELDGLSRLKMGLWSALARLGGGRGPDVRGGAQAVAYLRFPAVDPEHGDALRDVLIDGLRIRRGRDRFSAVLAGFHEKDPLRACLRGLARFSVRSSLILTVADRDPLLTPEAYDRQRPFYADMSLV